MKSISGVLSRRALVLSGISAIFQTTIARANPAIPVLLFLLVVRLAGITFSIGRSALIKKHTKTIYAAATKAGKAIKATYNSKALNIAAETYGKIEVVRFVITTAHGVALSKKSWLEQPLYFKSDVAYSEASLKLRILEKVSGTVIEERRIGLPPNIVKGQSYDYGDIYFDKPLDDGEYIVETQFFSRGKAIGGAKRREILAVPEDLANEINLLLSSGK